MVGRYRKWMAGEVISGPSLQPDNLNPPIFFAGFPRSGTMLMEQFLGSHPNLQTMGQRSPLWQIIGRSESVIGRSSDVTLIDKLPLNIVYPAPITRLFPDSREIVAICDPRDICLSAYMQSFHHNTAVQSFMILESTGDTYAAVMDLWFAYRKRITVP